MTGPAQVRITAESVIGFLGSRGVATGDLPAVTPLAGGVSGTVLLVEGAGRRIVVKQALEQLLVRAEWFATPRRAVTEAAAMALLHPLTPDRLPALLDVSEADCALVMTAAPAGWASWKELLLHGPVDVQREGRVAQELGRVLATWHRRTADDAVVAAGFADYEALEQLRITPFHREILARHPLLADAVGRCLRDLTELRQCLVHGDFSPKNVLVDPAGDGVWALDLEVAHYGAAVFDLAFLHAHLLLKAIHRVDRARALRAVAEKFQHAYAAQVGDGLGALATTRLGWHTACLVLARVSGLSPVGYLTAQQQQVACELATRALGAPERPVQDLWALLVGGGRR